MKYSLLFLLFTLQNLVAQNPFNCSSHLLFEKNMLENPQFRANQQQLELETKAFLESMGQHQTTAISYIIPVVFHVIHTGGSGNISEAQIQNQIAILNKEFIRMQADTTLTPNAFKPLAAPFGVEFRLATLDPNGQCTNGINRIYSSLSDCSLAQEDIKALSYWPSNKYLNIWLVQSMHYSGTLDCGGGGYASFPGGPPNLDGINIRGDLIGSIGTAASNSGWGNFLGRYLIHELGHWFNLRHIWGDAVCGDDFVADTPPALTSNNNCPNFPQNPNSTCAGSNANGEMFTDYMDYTNGPCLNMFTAGQVARMTACITSTVSGRNNLWSTNNLNATGTNNPYTYPVACVATPEALPYGTIIACAGDSVKLSDVSYGGNTGTRLWDFNGEPASSLTDSVVRVKYSFPGTYSFMLKKTYLSSSKTTTFNNKVVIIGNTPTPNYVVPFVDDFETTQNFYSDWTIVDRDNNGVTWDLNNSTGFSGFNCIGLNNFTNKAPLIDDIISPAYDLTSVENPTLSFKVAFARKAATNYDKLQVFISKNCGANWISIYQRTGTSLPTVSLNVASSYTPVTASDEWRTDKINIMPQLGGDIVHFKFSFTSGGGNNIFIDDINLDGLNTTGIKSLKPGSVFSLYPNPASNETKLIFDSKLEGEFEIQVTDITGRVCQSYSSIDSQKSGGVYALQLKNLEAGIYFVSLGQQGRIVYKQKLILTGN